MIAGNLTYFCPTLYLDCVPPSFSKVRALTMRNVIIKDKETRNFSEPFMPSFYFQITCCFLLPALKLLGLWTHEPFSRAVEVCPIPPGMTCEFHPSPPQPDSALELTSFSFLRGS